MKPLRVSEISRYKSLDRDIIASFRSTAFESLLPK